MTGIAQSAKTRPAAKSVVARKNLPYVIADPSFLWVSPLYDEN